MKRFAALILVLVCVLGLVGCAEEEYPAKLTMDDVKRLVEQHGEDLTWHHFDGYQYEETGSGLYIRVYQIDNVYSLWIGGRADTTERPMYIHLEAGGIDSAAFIDVWHDSIEEFIGEK